MMEEKELIWVPKDFAEQHKELMADKTRRDEQLKVFNDYMKSVKDSSARGFRANLESLEEDAAMYTGLMIKVKKTFESAKDEQMSASYDLWERFEKELPATSEKIDAITSLIKPLVGKIETLNKELQKINTFEINRIVDAIHSLSGLSGESKSMIDFLIDNFQKGAE
jgi:archaellum component FlaC